MDATDSESNLAAREAVISFMSYLGQSSTISIPTIPELTACLTKQVSSTLVSPHGVGTDTPGAYAGSRQSRSIDTYFLEVFLRTNFVDCPVNAILYYVQRRYNLKTASLNIFNFF